MDTEVTQTRKELRKQRKEEEKNLEKHRQRARKWWGAVTKLFYELSIDGNNKNFKVSSGEIKVPEQTEAEADKKLEKDIRNRRRLIFSYFFVCIFFVPAIALSIYFNSAAGIFGAPLVMFLFIIIIKIFERSKKFGLKRYTDDKDANKERLTKAIALLAKSKGCSKDDATVYILGGFEKKRTVFKCMCRGHMLGMLFTAMLLPSVAHLVDEQYVHIIVTIFTFPLLSKWDYILLENIPAIGMTVHSFLYWFVTVAVCILIQLPTNIVIRNIARLLSNDELFLFYKEYVFKDRIKQFDDE